jgi:hypothetical protein
MGKHQRVLRWMKAGGLVLLVAALVLIPGSRPASAHAIVVDGNSGDWCYPGLLPVTGPDTRSSLASPACVLGNEVVWEDGIGDLQLGVNDVATFATTGDPGTVYFIVEYLGGMTGLEHIQIAIDVAPGVGNNTWYNPLAAPLSLVGMAVPPGPIAPDYLITSDITGASGSPGWLWEATTNPGSWTVVGPVPLAFGATAVEVGVPWAMFTPGPPFGPGSTANITLLQTLDDWICTGTTPGAPCPVPEDDLLSEPLAGTFTTTPNSCPTGAGATACEVGDGSADAFISVTYLAPTAVGVQKAAASGVQNWALPALVALPAAGLTARLLARRRSRGAG